MKLQFGTRSLWVADAAMESTIAAAQRAARTDRPCLISGESGTGKELIARYIHQSGRAEHGSFVSVNCAAIPDSLMESELFGHERGAFTGAYVQRVGKFERAHRGTILLDEVSEMPLHLQAKLLRVLQEGEVDRIGSTGPIAVDSRVIATSNRDLAAMVRAGEFRADLFFRLNVVHIRCAPLRGRPHAILKLSRAVLERRTVALGMDRVELSTEAAQLLVQHAWPGNVRELENTLERGLLHCEGRLLRAEHLELVSLDAPSSSTRGMTLAKVERSHILEVMAQSDGNRSRAAEVLGISVRTLHNKLKEYSAE